VARYTGPDCKLCRREGIKLFLKGERCFTKKCAIERRPLPPGQQAAARRHKPSDYALQLREKQKVRRIYGVLERQFKRIFEESERRPGATGENLLQLLELRLDNVVYRLGFAASRDQARQLVTHGHFEVNGRRASIPSMRVKPGDIITVKSSSRELEPFKSLVESRGRRAPVPAWLQFDEETLTGRVVSLPTRNEVDAPVNEQLIVEYYSR
jgi:small subunit ribosomal protein S4